MPETKVSSFMLRFVQEGDSDRGSKATGWHGTIRHVQSNKQLRFTCMEDALKFMADYVPLATEQITDKEIPLNDNQ